MDASTRMPLAAGKTGNPGLVEARAMTPRLRPSRLSAPEPPCSSRQAPARPAWASLGMLSAALGLLLAACGAPRPAVQLPGPAAFDVVETPPAPADDDIDMGSGIQQGVTHGSSSRTRAEQLDTMISEILEVTKPAAAGIRSRLGHAIDALQVPEKLATNEYGLRGWREERRDGYVNEVETLYNDAEGQLLTLLDAAMTTARNQARRLAPVRSPLDAGATGEPVLDKRLTTLEEFLNGKVALSDVDASREQDKKRVTELVQVFSSFGVDGADEALGGRLLLFVGTSSEDGRPRCMVVYRSDEGMPESHAMAQVMRHRVLRGSTIVYDRGWRALPGLAPGYPETEVFDNFAMAPAVEPVVLDDPRLRDMRIIIDVQTAVVGPSGELRGGVDWRLEYSVSTRGDTSWELSQQGPVFDPFCTEVKRALGHS